MYTYVIIRMVYTNTDFVSGVQINYKTNGYPASPDDGNSIIVDGTPMEIIINNLINKTNYYFRIFLFNMINNKKYYQTDITNAKEIGTPVYIGVSGVTPLVIADDHIVITTSGQFSLISPPGKHFKLILGGGEEKGGVITEYDSTLPIRGGYGGYTKQFEFDSISQETFCTLTLGQAVSYGSGLTSSTLIIDNQTYSADAYSGRSIITSKWSPIGGDGGSGSSHNYTHGAKTMSELSDGIGAGGAGGFCNGSTNTASKYGGNYNGYGNRGGNNGWVNAQRVDVGGDGSSGLGGRLSKRIENGIVKAENTYQGGWCGGGDGYYCNYVSSAEMAVLEFL